MGLAPGRRPKEVAPLVPLEFYLVLGAALFGLGLYGALARPNAVRILMAIELMLNAANINLLAFNRYLHPADLRGQVLAVFVITVAAAEAALGLAIVFLLARRRHGIDVDRITLLRG